LDKLEAFASVNGANFYDLPVNRETVTLERKPSLIPKSINLNNEESLVPFLAGELLGWKLLD